jgi:hypothetical protein
MKLRSAVCIEITDARACPRTTMVDHHRRSDGGLDWIHVIFIKKLKTMENLERRFVYIA